MPAADALGGDPQSYVDGLHHALIASGVLAIVGAVLTAWLLIPAEPATEGEAETEAVAEAA